MAIDLNRMRDFKHEDNLLKEKQEQPNNDMQTVKKSQNRKHPQLPRNKH